MTTKIYCIVSAAYKVIMWVVGSTTVDNNDNDNDAEHNKLMIIKTAKKYILYTCAMCMK